MQTIHLLRLNVMYGEKNQSSAHLLHQQIGCYNYYCDYFTFSFQAICTVPSLCELHFSLHLWVGVIRWIYIQLLFISFLSNIVVNCFYYLCSKYDDIVNKLLKYEK